MVQLQQKISQPNKAEVSDQNQNQSGHGTGTGDNTTSTTTAPKPVRLKRKLGFIEAVGITVGCIIGSGIFISPKGITQHVASVGASLVIWAACGFLSILGAFCFAELGTTFPTAGGQYTYIYEGFGPLVAFLSLWVNVILFTPISNAVVSLVFAKYVTQPFFPHGCTTESTDVAVQLLACAMICLLSALNCCDIKVINKLVNVFMCLKLTAVGLIIVGGGFAIYHDGTHNFSNPWEGTNVTPESILFSIYAGSFAFGGWSAMATMMEELKNPSRNLPAAIFASLSLVTLVYLLANVAYFAVLSPAEMIASDAVAVTFVRKLVGPYLVWIVPCLVAMSTVGLLSVHILTNSRNYFVGARHGHLPPFLHLISLAYHTPVSAIVFQALLSLAFLYTVDVFALINFSGFLHTLVQTLCIISLIYLRMTRPTLKRPFKVHMSIPIVYLVISIILTALPIYVAPVDTAISLAITLTGLPIYYLFIEDNALRSRKPFLIVIQKIDALNVWITIQTQKLLLSVKEDEELKEA